VGVNREKGGAKRVATTEETGGTLRLMGGLKGGGGCTAGSKGVIVQREKSLHTVMQVIGTKGPLLKGTRTQRQLEKKKKKKGHV